MNPLQPAALSDRDRGCTAMVPDHEGDGTFKHPVAEPDTPLVTSKASRPTVNLAQPQKSKDCRV